MIYAGVTKDGAKIQLRPFVVGDMTQRYRDWFHDAEVTAHNDHGLFPYGADKEREFLADIGGGRRIVWAIEIEQSVQAKLFFGTDPAAMMGGTAWEDVPNNNMFLGVDPTYNPWYSTWKLVGNCSLQSFNWINRSAEMAIVIGDRSVWGKGVASWAWEQMIYHGFMVLGLHRLWSGTSVENVGMIRVFEKCEMLREGTFCEAKWSRGRFIDVVEYAIIYE